MFTQGLRLDIQRRFFQNLLFTHPFQRKTAESLGSMAPGIQVPGIPVLGQPLRGHVALADFIPAPAMVMNMQALALDQRAQHILE